VGGGDEEMNDTTRKTYTKTPWLKRAPTVATLTLGLVVAFQFGQKWLGFAAMVGTWIVCILILHFAFRQPMARLLQYREFENTQTLD
jgi:cytochrome bd-type quinol oxidase subunit 1